MLVTPSCIALTAECERCTYINGVDPKLSRTDSPCDRLTAGKYATPGPRQMFSNAAPMLTPFLQQRKVRSL